MKASSLLKLLLVFANYKASKADKFEEAIKHIDTQVLNRSELIYLHKRLLEHKQENVESLKLDPQRQAMLDSLEEELQRTEVEQVQFSSVGDDIETINKNKGIGDFLYQSDIVLTEWQVDEILRTKHDRRSRQAFRDEKYPETIWPNAIVHFSFSSNATNKFRDLFRHGALEWQRETCLNFYEYIHAPHRIELVSETGCWSHVGNMHRVQALSLGEGCDAIGIAAHEIAHALGMFHHHARHDRDEHIFIDESKIMDGMYDQFTKQTKDTNNNYGLPYEYGSVMHYGSRSFSADKTRWHTMIPNDKLYIDTLGSQFINVSRIPRLNAQWEDFQTPKDCLRCVCPGGYGGILCNERPSGCGEVLQATTDYKKFEDVVGHSWVKKSEENDFFAMCKYWIEAPLGRTVEVKFHNFTERVAVQGCYYAGVEIKTQRDQRSTGYRFCSPSYTGEVFKSASNVVPIITWSRIWPIKVELWYRMV
ncbi:unnamed protein product [Cylicocyclus nassatus]|uniref:Zinc metalloproteinase n=1 Tax=Cylicocyclus nassatus TaxID=53992 RepID=A0AA36H124_CYLNA|nr:unnamed protein product [Cylicocyclus nassatus]